MKFGELIEHCITCIKTFNPVIKTIDSHADDFIANVSNRDVQLIPLLFCIVQGPIRESLCQVNILWLHKISRFPEGKS